MFPKVEDDRRKFMSMAAMSFAGAGLAFAGPTRSQTTTRATTGAGRAVRQAHVFGRTEAGRSRRTERRLRGGRAG